MITAQLTMDGSNPTSMEPEITPTYVQCFTDIYNSMSTFLSKPQNSFANYSVPMDFVKDMMRYGDVTRYDIAFVFLLAASMTIIRTILTKAVFLVCKTCFYLKFKKWQMCIFKHFRSKS